MTDNTSLNQNYNQGDVISTEDIGSYRIQRVKLATGAHAVDGGDVTPSNPLAVAVVDLAGNLSRGANDDTLILLRRLIEVCETLATQDSSNRQKVCIDSITAALTLATVSTVTSIGSVTNVASMGGYPEQWRMMESARNAYANGIRSKLV